MTFRNLSYHKMFSNREKKGKYNKMCEIYLFQFSKKQNKKKTFCGKIKLTIK